MPAWDTFNAGGYDIREHGTNAIQELAFSFTSTIEVVREALRLGLQPDESIGRLTFFWAMHSDFFEEIAKVRAARRIWAKLTREKFGAKDPKSWRMRFHTHTIGSSLTAQQPLNNVVRASIQTLAAILAGAQGIHTSAYDEALSLPTEEAATLALRTQEIIHHETGVTDVVDPLGGSYYLENLTNKMEEETWKLIDKIESMGGYIACIENNFLRAEGTRYSYKYYKEIEEGERVIVGVNKYVTEEKIPIKPFPYDPQIEEVTINRLRKVREERDNEEVKRRLRELKETAETPDAELMPVVIEVVKSYATVGEISKTLKEVFGSYQESPQMAAAIA
jgi:methylmalonyl-CoA mutase N-terminal domain/subunit